VIPRLEATWGEATPLRKGVLFHLFSRHYSLPFRTGQWQSQQRANTAAAVGTAGRPDFDPSDLEDQPLRFQAAIGMTRTIRERTGRWCRDGAPDARHALKLTSGSGVRALPAIEAVGCTGPVQRVGGALAGSTEFEPIDTFYVFDSVGRAH
jgi:hypothetical protein